MPVLEASVYFFIWQTWLVSCWMDPFFFFFKRNLRNKLSRRKYLSKWDEEKKLCAKEHCSSRSLYVCKLSLVFKPVTAQSQAGRSRRFVKNKEEGDSPAASFLHPALMRMSLQFHFLHSSHARAIVPLRLAANTVTSSHGAVRVVVFERGK